MTNASLISALILATAIAGILGWLLRRWPATQSNAASIAISIAALTTLPILLHPDDGWLRMLFPREALEWMPLGLTLLLAMEILRDRSTQRVYVCRAVGVACCFLIVARMMWGSIYLKPGSLQWNYIAFLLAWAGTMSWLWAVRPTASGEKPRLFDGILQLSLLLAVAVNLGLSGSITYFAAGLLMVAISAASWIGSRLLSQLTWVATASLVGLGPTFSETSWWAASLLLLATLAAGFASLCKTGRTRIIATTFVLIATILASSLTGYKFWQSISNKNDSSSGYEAYR